MDSHIEETNKLLARLETAPKSAFQQLAETAPTKEPEASDETKDPFAFVRFMEMSDENGVPMAQPSYVKKSCNSCYARGFFVETKADKTGRYKLCRCVENSYRRAAKLDIKVRKSEARMAALAEKYG